MGTLVRFPRARRAVVRLGLDQQDTLTELDAELRSIDQAMRALAERKRVVLESYRREAKRPIGGLTVGPWL
jgi:hypothetical protein